MARANGQTGHVPALGEKRGATGRAPPRGPLRDRSSGLPDNRHSARPDEAGSPYNPRVMNPPRLSLPGQAILSSPRVTSGAVARLLSVRRLWFPVALPVAGLYAGLPWLAPVFMRLGWTAPAQVIYDIYSTQCHQLAQRSYFLFGSKIMYAPSELEIADATAGFSALRAFRGAPGIGWKVAWSDRMAAMYTGLFVFMIVARLLR